MIFAELDVRTDELGSLDSKGVGLWTKWGEGKRSPEAVFV